MKYKHTPGPWEASYIFRPDSVGPISIVGTDPECRQVAKVYRNGDQTRQEADSALIAAAPELLEACQAALAWIMDTQPMEHGNPELGKAWGLLENAIGKAEG